MKQTVQCRPFTNMFIRLSIRCDQLEHKKKIPAYVYRYFVLMTFVSKTVYSYVPYQENYLVCFDDVIFMFNYLLTTEKRKHSSTQLE